MNMNVYVNEQFPYLDFMDIRPGDRVVLKPNLVKEGKETELVDDVLMKVIEKIEVPSDKVKRGRRSHEER